MATDAAGDLIYYLCVHNSYREELWGLRTFTHIKIAQEDEYTWAKDLTWSQANSVLVKSLPGKELFYAVGGRLFKIGSRLPHRMIPPLLWTPVEQALPLSRPAYNHNYFGLQHNITVALVPSDEPTEADLLVTSRDLLAAYIETAPAVRLEGLSWSVLNSDTCLVLGKPLLPLNGEAYYTRHNHLIPAGYKLNLPILLQPISEALAADASVWVFWHLKGYSLISKHAFMPLTTSSFRITFNSLSV